MDEVKIGESNEVLSLKARVESLPYGEIKPDLRARLSVEMVKDAINLKKVTPEAAKQFAASLIEDCGVPVMIGTPETKVFPIEDIIKARPLVVENMKDAARSEGINYEEAVGTRRRMAEEAVMVFEKEYERQNQKYGLFAQYLSPKQRSEEAESQVARITVAKQILQGSGTDQIKTDDESMLDFIQIDVSNTYFGQELQSWLSNH